MKKFDKNDILVNSIKTYPKTKFDIWNTNIYLNRGASYSGSFVSNLNNVPQGYLSLLEINVDRDFSNHTFDSQLGTGNKTKIFPFVYKDSDFFSTIGMTTEDYSGNFSYGDMITSSYDISSSIGRSYYSESQTRSFVSALKGTFDYYSKYSPHFFYSSSYGNKETQKLNLIQIPKIFYGDSINKGSVKLTFYISGTAIGELQDLYKNGCLYQVSGTYSGSNYVAGQVLYNEGIISLTGSWNLSGDSYKFDAGVAHAPRWIDFAAGCNDGLSTSDVTPSASFSLEFEGVNLINTITMFCHANKGELNFSNNPTFLDRNSSSFSYTTSSNGFIENKNYIKNIVSSSFHEYSESFERITYITEIYVYDKLGNIVGIANTSRPIKKKENLDYTFKIKYDL